MSRRAAEAAGLEGLNEHLTGPNAIAFSNEDVVAPAKILNDFAKKNDKLEIKAGVIEGDLHLKQTLKHWRNFRHAKVYFLCYSAYFKLQCATLRLQQKQLQSKKKNKALNKAA